MHKSIYVKQILTAFFWAGMYVAAKVVTAEVPPVSTTFLRFLLAGLLLLALWGASDQKLPKGREWLSLLLLAVSGVLFYNILFFTGIKTVSVVRAAVIIATNPILTAILARFIFKEKLPPQKIVGISLAAAGAIWVITRGSPLMLFSSALSTGDLILCAAALTWSIYSLLNKASKSMPPLTTITFTCLIGCALVTPLAVHENVLFYIQTASLKAWGALVYISVCATVISFVWFNHGIITLGAQRASLFINLIPAFALFFGAVFFKEDAPLWLAGGILIICFGIFLANRRI